jgi:hypothetical protein
MSGPFCYLIHTFARGRCDTREEIPTVHLLVLQHGFSEITKPGVMKDVKAWASPTLE